MNGTIQPAIKAATMKTNPTMPIETPKVKTAVAMVGAMVCASPDNACANPKVPPWASRGIKRN